jgi:hypothetical protein
MIRARRQRLQAWWRGMCDRLCDHVCPASAMAPSGWDVRSMCAHAGCMRNVPHNSAHVCGDSLAPTAYSCARFFCFGHLHPTVAPAADGTPQVASVCMECLLAMQAGAWCAGSGSASAKKPLAVSLMAGRGRNIRR